MMVLQGALMTLLKRFVDVETLKSVRMKDGICFVSQVVGKLTDCMTKISKTDATAETTKNVTPIKLGNNYKEELKMVNPLPSTSDIKF